LENVVPGSRRGWPIIVPMTRSTIPRVAAAPAAGTATRCRAGRNRAQRLALELAALSRYSSCGLPLIGQQASTPNCSNQTRLSITMCVRHNPTEVADGASNVTTKPTSDRLNTSIPTVT
jgi:hypothetical protein